MSNLSVIGRQKFPRIFPVCVFARLCGWRSLIRWHRRRV